MKIVWLFSLLVATSVFAQDFPSKPIRIVVPYAAGGGTDAVSRLLATRLAAAFGQPVVVENKPGAATMLAARSDRIGPIPSSSMSACRA